MKRTMLKQLVVAAISLVVGSCCWGQSPSEPLELALMPGGSPMYLFARHAAATNERDAMGLKGPVRRVELRFEQESESSPGEIRRQPGSVVFEFDRDGSLVRMSRQGQPGEEAMSAEWEVILKDIGGTPKVVERNFKAGVGEGWIKATLFEYDEAGSVVKITTQLSEGREIVRRVERSKPGGEIAAIEEVIDSVKERREYDAEGRLVGLSRVFGDSERSMDQRISWSEGGVVRSEMGSGQVLFEGPIDEHGAFTKYAFNYGGRSMNMTRTAERDARGNWTTLTTTTQRPARDDQPARDWIMMRWVRVIEYWDNKPETPKP